MDESEVISTEKKNTKVKEAVEKYSISIVSFAECREVLNKYGIAYEGEIDRNSIVFPKIETQSECLAGSVVLPKAFDSLKKRYRFQFFIAGRRIVIADDDGFAEKIVQSIKKDIASTGKRKSGGYFVYQFLIYLMKQDSSVLERYEKKLTDMEEDVMNDDFEDFQDKLLPLRKDLLNLRAYYGQIADMAEELYDNGDMFFAKKDLRMFTVAMDRANRYKDKTIYLLDYANQVKDAYQAVVNEKQNANMQFLTILSTIFFPLTLITGWYGMNFQNMPELAHGYPGVIIGSVLVVIIIIIIFKKRKIF